MTVIAWDGKTLAADKRATNQGFTVPVVKIGTLPETSDGIRAYALSGDYAKALSMLAWWQGGCSGAEFPKSEGKEFAVLSLFGLRGFKTKPFVRIFENCAFPFETSARPWAAGSGRDFALMAMHLGKTAPEAVRLTSKLTVDCGNGVDVVRVR